MTSVVSKEGMLEVTGGKIWYQVFGKRNKIPLIVLHGGPGFPHNSLLSLSELADQRQVIFFDQLGCGKSDRPTDKSLWTIAHYVEELSSLIKELGFEKFNLFGHSWGSILALEYYLQHPAGIEKLVFASPVFSSSRWAKDGETYVRALSKEHQSVIQAHDSGKPFNLDTFKQAEAEYNRRHLCRLNPWPKDLKKSVAGLGQLVYHHMWGKSEWKSSGELKNYERINKLQEIQVPVLLTCGYYDNPTPDTVNFYAGHVRNAAVKIFKNSSHSAFLEERTEFVDSLREFLD